MAEAAAVTWLLGVLSACAVVLTVTALVAAWRAQRTLRRLEAFLPTCELAMRRFGSVLERVSSAADAACGVATGVREGMSWLKAKTAAFLWGHQGNGAGGGPRRRPGATTGQGRRKG
jgi:hypothetical protein